mmetsp:Transcript_11202/g.31319  ORF Transcript_11202/g.31319 Transcript_11202/m.31319 type:complete len:253 (+) Transcript_11202:980-1738(+)
MVRSTLTCRSPGTRRSWSGMWAVRCRLVRHRRWWMPSLARGWASSRRTRWSLRGKLLATRGRLRRGRPRRRRSLSFCRASMRLLTSRTPLIRPRTISPPSTGLRPRQSCSCTGLTASFQRRTATTGLRVRLFARIWHCATSSALRTRPGRARTWTALNSRGCATLTRTRSSWWQANARGSRAATRNRTPSVRLFKCAATGRRRCCSRTRTSRTQTVHLAAMRAVMRSQDPLPTIRTMRTKRMQPRWRHRRLF